MLGEQQDTQTPILVTNTHTQSFMKEKTSSSPTSSIPLTILSDIQGLLLLPVVELPTFQLSLPQEAASIPI